MKTSVLQLISMITQLHGNFIVAKKETAAATPAAEPWLKCIV